MIYILGINNLWSCEQFPGDDKVLQEDPVCLPALPAGETPRHAGVPPGQLVQDGVPRALGGNLCKNCWSVTYTYSSKEYNMV